MSNQRKLPFTKEEFQQIYSRVPRLCVDIAIVSEKGLLLSKRTEASWSGQWHLPGGTVYYREALHQALARIGQEELMVQVKPIKLFGYLEYPSEIEARGFGYSVGIVFICEYRGEIPAVNESGEEIAWFKEVPENMIAEQATIFEDLLKEF